MLEIVLATGMALVTVLLVLVLVTGTALLTARTRHRPASFANWRREQPKSGTSSREWMGDHAAGGLLASRAAVPVAVGFTVMPVLFWLLYLLAYALVVYLAVRFGVRDGLRVARREEQGDRAERGH
jgi:uncharacterized iron-regulated membrane protein